MSLGWMSRALSPKNWVRADLRPYVTPAEARAMSAWPVMGSVTVAVVEGEVLDWPSWAVLLSALAIVITWVAIATDRVCQRALKRRDHESLRP